MSTINELFAPHFMDGDELTIEMQDAMAKELKADSLRYLPVESIAAAVGFDRSELCQACITGTYPTPMGQQLYSIAIDNASNGNDTARTYESETTKI
jgi:amidophosphoribosyltransferase